MWNNSDTSPKFATDVLDVLPHKPVAKILILDSKVIHGKAFILFNVKYLSYAVCRRCQAPLVSWWTFTRRFFAKDV